MACVTSLDSVDEEKRQARLEQLTAAESLRKQDIERRREDNRCAHVRVHTLQHTSNTRAGSAVWV